MADRRHRCNCHVSKDLLASGVLTYYLLNTFDDDGLAVSVSYLLGLFVKNSNMLNGLSNIVSLGMCFCPVFFTNECYG